MQRGLRQKLLETYPGFEPFIEDVMPKKASLEAVKLYSSHFTHFLPSNSSNVISGFQHEPTMHLIPDTPKLTKTTTPDPTA